MPYIAIKAYPKDSETKKKVTERINQVFLEEWGCPPQAITVSIEEIEPAEWEEKVIKPQIEPNKDKMMILSGEKCY
ncbi:MAG: 4-oxalocrotonate tautomerase [Ruminococcaceae bacterium]|nr:4-oxalocrotonate tautomerase [Oscillospiraceae bacterium]